MSSYNLTKSEKRNRNNHFTIFAQYRCLSQNEHRFVALPHSIINHCSFTSLKDKTKLLYLYMTDYSQGNQEFTYPRRIYKNLMCNETFDNAINELIEHGFIEIVSNGGLCNNENIYKFVSKWKTFIPEPKKKRKTKIQENKTKSN